MYNYESRCPMTRKEAREEAFIIVFEKIFRDDSIDDIISSAKEANLYKEDEYASDVAFGVYENIEKIDELIAKNSKGWSISRISKVTLAAMRIAVYEIYFRDDVPVSVSINEAVEIIKKFASVDDSSFANGILGTIAKNK